MAQRVNGISGMIARVKNVCDTVTLQDTSELAKMFARLERIAETLEDMGHDAAAFAQLLSGVVEQIVDGQAHPDALQLVKQGVSALQVSYSDKSNNENTIDPSLMDQFQEMMQTSLLHQDPVTLDEDLDEDLDDEDVEEIVPLESKTDDLEREADLPEIQQDAAEDLVVDMDGIDWKSLPEIDLDALEDKVAEEQSNLVNEDSETQYARLNGQDNDSLAEEAQEIRAQLSETGYIVFDQAENPVKSDEESVASDEGAEEDDLEAMQDVMEEEPEAVEVSDEESVASDEGADEDDLEAMQDMMEAESEGVEVPDEESVASDDEGADLDDLEAMQDMIEEELEAEDVSDEESVVSDDDAEDDDLEVMQDVMEEELEAEEVSDEESVVSDDDAEDDDLEVMQDVMEDEPEVVEVPDEELVVSDEGAGEDDLEVMQDVMAEEPEDDLVDELMDAGEREMIEPVSSDLPADEDVAVPLGTDSEMDIDELDENGLTVMANAVTAFLEDGIEEKPEIQTVDDIVDDDISINTDDNTEPPVGDAMKEDSFWTDAEPISEPDPDIPKTTTEVEPLSDLSEDSFLGQLALETMTLDLDDMTGLGRVHTQLETLSSEYDTRPLFTQLTCALGAVIEKIILFECDDVEDPLALICEGVTELQQMDQEITRGASERFADESLVSKIMEVAGMDFGQLDSLGDDEVAPEPVEEKEDVEQEPIDVDQDIFFDFASEAGEHLETAESKLLELDSHSEDTEVINAVFRSFHTIKGASSFLNLEDVTRVAHSVEDVLDSARKGSLALTPSILDVALESLDLLAQLIGNTKEALENGQPVYAKDVTYFLDKVARAASGEPEPDTAPVVIDAPGAEESAVEKTPASTDAPPVSGESTTENRGQSREQSFVRVGTDKLDQLVNLVGELVIAQTQVSQNPDVVNTENQKLTKDISQLMKISTDIQEISMSMRMVPIKGTFERMARIIRDLSRKCGKQVRFEVSGEDTELDKNVVEELVDPLTHMVRNAVDHGIESEEDRVAVGKPNQGSVHLNAYHKGGNIVIELRDDGKGLDRDKIMKKAVERGLVEADAQMSDEEVFALVFLPGFSTAEQVSDISGRGVGMDVVRRNIEGLRGRVEVTSVLGEGSVFTIRLPLTLAIIDGMVIGVGQQRYILPMTAIVRSLRPEKDDVFYVMDKGEMIQVQEELLPVVRLYNRFGVPPTSKDIWGSLVVIVESEGKRCGVMVDELLGMQQVVIKGLHDRLRKEPCLSGCAILGDGRVGLILDANGLVKQRTQKDKARDSNGTAYRSAS